MPMKTAVSDSRNNVGPSPGQTKALARKAEARERRRTALDEEARTAGVTPMKLLQARQLAVDEIAQSARRTILPVARTEPKSVSLYDAMERFWWS